LNLLGCRCSKADRIDDAEAPDEKSIEELELYVRMKKLFESKRSMSGTQAFTALVASVIVIGVLGLLSGFLPFYGIIIASVLSTIGIMSMLENMGKRSVDRFLERYRQEKEES